MKLSQRGLEFIASHEGFVDHAYDDPAGYATVGFGHLLHRSRVTDADRKQWGKLSREKALALLRSDASAAERAVNSYVRKPLTQAQYDALVSFVFNVGGGAFENSTLLKKLNRGDKPGAADELLKWDMAGGKHLPGLARRRVEERKLFTGKQRAKPAKKAPTNPWKAKVYGDTDCDKALLVGLGQVAADIGPNVRAYVRNGKRSYAEQTVLWREFQARGKRPPLVAPPGKSNHETGKAADTQLTLPGKWMKNIGDVKGARTSMKRHGLCLPVPGETWHVERGNTWRV